MKLVPARAAQDAKESSASTAAPATTASKKSSDCESSIWSAVQSDPGTQKETEAVLRKRRLAAMGSAQNIAPEQQDASVTSESDSDNNSVAPGQLGQSSTSSKRSNTRCNKEKGPAWNQRKLQKAIAHNLAKGIGPPEGEQMAKAEQFTGLKGEEAMTAYKLLIKQRVQEAEANNMSPEEKRQWFTDHLTKQTAAISDTVAAAAEKEHLMKQTQNLFVRQNDTWTCYCHLFAKKNDESHLASKAHRDAVELSATMSWMCGGIPRILREPHKGAPAFGAVCQQMCKAWWGPHLDNMRAQVLRTFAKLDTVTFHTKT